MAKVRNRMILVSSCRQKKGYRFVCVDVLHLDVRTRAKHRKLKTSLVGKKILENSVIFVYSMAR